MPANTAELSEALTAIFKSLTVIISRNHNPQTSDTWVLSVSELKKNFIFDNNTGKFLGSIDMPEPVPVNEYATHRQAHSPFGPMGILLGGMARALPTLPSPLEPTADYAEDISDVLIRKFGQR